MKIHVFNNQRMKKIIKGVREGKNFRNKLIKPLHLQRGSKGRKTCPRAPS